jgi:hypothetical protein
VGWTEIYLEHVCETYALVVVWWRFVSAAPPDYDCQKLYRACHAPVKGRGGEGWRGGGGDIRELEHVSVRCGRGGVPPVSPLVTS